MTSDVQKQKFYGWILLPFLCLIYAIPIGFAFYGPPIINTFMATDLNLPRGQINVGYSFIGMLLGIGALFIPWLIDRFGPRKTLVIGAFITAVSGLLMALFGHLTVVLFGHSYPLVYWLLCILVGLGISFGTVVPIQTLVLLWFNVHRALVMGLVLGGGAIGGFIFPQIISNSIISAGGDWRVGWYIIAATCFIGGIIALLTVKDRPEDLGQHPDGLSPQQLAVAAEHTKHRLIKTYRSPIDWEFRDAIRTRALWIIVAAESLILFLWQVVLTQTPPHLCDRGFSPSDPFLFLQPAFVYGLILAFSILGRLSVSFLGERIESRFLISIAGASLLIGGVLFWVASNQMLWAVYLFPLFTGFGFGTAYVCMPLITGNYFGVKSFPGIMRIINPINSVVQFAAPAVAGFIFDVNGSYGPAILIGCCSALVGALLISTCTPPKPGIKPAD